MFCCFGQTSNKRVCRLGFTYDISKNSNWGKNNLVVTSVSPYSNAEKAGIQPYDIITHIESIPVSDVSNDEIAQLLNPANKRNIMLTIKSTSSPSREVILNKECKQINEISENQLAMAFNMYSLETTSEREFVCPFKTVATTDTVDFGQFRSYKFAATDENTELEANINRVIEKELAKKGFTSDEQSPDLLIQTFYYFDKNPNYVGPQMQRDYAYHQGTAWPWLAGFYFEAYLRIYKMSGIGFVERQLIGYEDEMTSHCIGSIPELFDGNPPFKGRGAVSFAMNVAEILRVLYLLSKYLSLIHI